MGVAIVALAVVNIVIWGYLAAYQDRPEIGERDPFTAWIHERRGTMRARRTTALMRERMRDAA